MIVSNFTLSLSDRSRSLLDVRYVLQLTNLEGEAIGFLIECHVTPPVNEPQPVGYVSSVLSAAVNANRLWAIRSFRRGDIVLVRYGLEVGAQRSISFELSTADPWGRPLRGFIVLRVPPLVSRERQQLPRPQVAHPVRVLLDARREQRQWQDTYIRDLDNHYVMQVSQGLWQSSTAIALASGCAENELMPEGSRRYEVEQSWSRFGG